jgi:hypothetical protein
MKKLISSLVFLTVLMILSSSALAQTNPETVVRNLYQAAKTKAVAEMSKAELRKYFDKELADSIWKESNSENGLNFDILYNAQDTRISNFQVSKAAPQTAVVSYWNVTFTNFGKKDRLNIELSNYDGKGWKISEITYRDRSTLTEILSSDY